MRCAPLLLAAAIFLPGCPSLPSCHWYPAPPITWSPEMGDPGFTTADPTGAVLPERARIALVEVTSLYQLPGDGIRDRSTSAQLAIAPTEIVDLHRWQPNLRAIGRVDTLFFSPEPRAKTPRPIWVDPKTLCHTEPAFLIDAGRAAQADLLIVYTTSVSGATRPLFPPLGAVAHTFSLSLLPEAQARGRAEAVAWAIDLCTGRPVARVEADATTWTLAGSRWDHHAAEQMARAARSQALATLGPKLERHLLPLRATP